MKPSYSLPNSNMELQNSLRVESMTSITSTIPQSPASSTNQPSTFQPTVFSADAPHKTPPAVPPRRPSLTTRLQETMTGSFGFDEDEDD